MRLKTKPYLVWHPNSSGDKVVVFRNIVQRMVYPRNVAAIGEQMYRGHLTCAINCTGETDE